MDRIPETEPAPRPSRARRLVMFPVTRIVIGGAFVATAMIAAGTLGDLVGDTVDFEGGIGSAITSVLLMAPASLFAYWGFVRLVERRPVTELALGRMPLELGLGWLSGAALFTLVIGVLALAGTFSVVGGGRWSVLITSFLISLGPAIFEELAFRGVLFRVVEEALGSWIALAFTSAVFGMLHLVNPDATLQGALAIVLEAGLMLGAAFMLTRRLWLVIGIHAAWNYVQGGIFGISVSGTGARGFLESRLEGPEILTGGEFGAEGSIVAVALGLAVGVAFLVLASRRGHVVRPFWARRGRKSV